MAVLKVFTKALLPIFCLASAIGAEPERSVIQTMCFVQQPVWDAPWRFEAVQRLGGSGFVIKGKRILTNAHVVSWARQIIVDVSRTRIRTWLKWNTSAMIATWLCSRLETLIFLTTSSRWSWDNCLRCARRS